MQIKWRLRLAAAHREVWTGAQLRRLLAERAGLQLSSASVSALLMTPRRQNMPPARLRPRQNRRLPGDGPCRRCDRPGQASPGDHLCPVR